MTRKAAKRSVPRIARKGLKNRYGGKCAYCGRPLARGWQRDHIEPLVRFKNVRYSFSGRHGCKYPERHTATNIVACCAPCNKDKGAMDLATWRASLKWPPLGRPVVFWFERYKEV